MFYYDLVAGHRWLVGDDRLLAGCEHHGLADAIPLHETTRLLFNRCSGLLFALERLRRPVFDAAEADFVGRNLAKAQLAFGDTWLAAHGEYHWSCRTRRERLACTEFPPDAGWAGRLKDHHTAGVEFKLHPYRSMASREELSARHAELSGLGCRLWLWLESRRLGRRFASVRDYACSDADKCPETAPVRNCLVNLQTFGLTGASCARYPRQRLFHSLALLLWEPDPLAEAALLARVQTELRSDACDLAGLIAAYQRLWNRFN